jgi:hypothetical protein
MKQSHLTQFLALSVGFILLSAVVPVNPASLRPSQQGTTFIAKGISLTLPDPPLTPKPVVGSFIDGVPLPVPEPPPPKGILASSIDGVPLPLPEPAPKKIT